MGLNPNSQEYKYLEAAYKENKNAGQSTNEAYKNALSQTNNGKNAVQPAAQPSDLSGPLSAYTDKKWINTGGGRRHVDNFEVRNGRIFDVASENAAIRNTQANYEQFLNGKLKEYGSGRTGRYGQYTNNFMDINRYAEHEMFMSTVNVNNLEKQLKELQKEYEKVRISGTGGSAETDLKKQIADVENQIKEYQLDAKAAGEYMNLVKESQAAEEAWNKAQEAGLNSMDWYDQTKAEYDDIQQQLDDLYDQRRDAVRAENMLHARNSGGTTGTVDYDGPSTADIEGQIIRLTYQQDALKKQLGYADRYRWESVDTTDEQAIALGKATYDQQHQQWTDQMETVSKLPTAGDYAAVSKRMLTLSTSKDYKEPTDDWTEQQKNTYYVLLGDGRDTRRADEFAMNTNNIIQQQKNQAQAEEVGEKATSSFYSGAWRTAVATGAGLASGLEYLGDVQELVARGVITEKPFGLADYNQAVTGSISNYLNNQYGTLGDNAGALAGKGLGDAYQIAQSVGQSWAAMALTGGSSAAVNLMFFGQAAKQTLDEQLAKGTDPYKAVLMGTLAGSAEVIGETFSLENIKGLQAGQTKGLLLDILRSAGIEGSEEGVTTLLNTFADRIVNGNDSDYYVALEGYISQGMSYADAERAAMKDWVNGIAYDMIAGAVSGGISGGVGGPAVRAANEVVTGFQEFDGDTKTLLETAASYKDTKAADLAAKYGGQESITVRQAGQLGKAIEKATAEQNERNIHNAISAELKARGVTSNTGDISDAIQKSASGKMLTKEEHYLVRDTPGARAIRDELYDRMTNGKLDAEKLAAEDTPQWLKNIEQKNGASVAGQAMFGKLLREEAEQRLTEADRIETINPEVTIGDVSGRVSGVTSTGKTAQITITGADGTQSSVNLEDALDSGAIPSDVAYLARSAAAFGPAANDVYNLYSPTQTAREYIAAMDAAINTVAANVGSRSAFEQSDSVKYLTKEQRDFAWYEGQKQRTQAQEKTVGKQDKGKKKTQPREGRVSYGGVTYEGQTFKATTADKVKPEARRVLEKFAAATGVNIVFYESEADQRGDYVGANGFYRNGTVHLDVHAGANSTSEKEAVLITASHEFTHFIRENAPRRYNQLKEFVTEHLLENGYDFETLVERKIKAAQKDGGLSRDAAIEEVVADACEMVLGNSKAIERLAKEKPGLANRIADWLHEFFSDIRKAFEGVEARHEEAKAMLDYMDELTKLWDDALVEAAESGGEVSPTESGVIYDNAGNPVAESTGDGTVMLSIRTYEEEGRDVLRKYLDTAVAQKKLTKTEAKDMAEEIERIYDICREFEGKYAQFGAWSRAEVVRDTHGRPVFSVVSPNGEYKMNLDFSLVCKKRRTLDAVFNEMARRGIIDDFELGQKSVVKINEIIRKHGFETACALCFVDAKRFRQASMADQFVRLYNELVTSIVSDDQQSNIAYFNFSQNTNRVAIKNGVDTWSSAKLDFSHLNHVMNTYGKGTVEYKAAKYIKDHAEGRKLLQRGDFMSSSGFDAVKIQNKTILKLYNSKKGTGGPKAAFGDVQYLNEIVRKAKSWTPEKAFAVGGVRVQSFSDYIPRMVFDYVQMIYDLAAVGLPAHAYTKETLFAKQFGLTGIKINMSLIPAIAKDGIAPGLDANGDYVWAGESFNYDEAVAIQNADGYTENCGTICVGVSEAHIRKLLRDPNIRMVIPYHKSGLNPIVAHMNKIAAFTDYTTLKTNPGGCQNTIDKDGNKVEKDFNFNAAVQKHGDPRAAADEYLKWCAANQYTAKFAEFANEDNYYKLLEDFTLYDNAGSFVPQRAVKAVFPTEESAFGSMKELIEAGLQEDAVIEGKRDKTLSAIVDEIEQTLPKTEAEIPETEVKQADRDIEAIDSRTKFSLREVEPIQPSSDKWKRTLTTAEAKSRFPSLWDVAAEESEVRNPTQISSTVKSYRKIYDFLKAEGFDGTILDASSGLGYGTRAGIEEYGFDVEDIEPYPDKSYNPKYKDYSTLNKKYDVIISNAVLNVLPQDQRDALTIKMGELLNDGGRIFINVRGKDVDTLASTKTNVNISPMEWFVGSTGSYQKGFTKPELVAYLQDALGDGFIVKPTNLFGAVSAVVTKDGGIKLSDRDYSKEPNVKKSRRDSEGNELSQKQQEFFKDSVVRDRSGNLLVVYHQTENDFTVFDPRRKGAGSRDTETPYGIFLKSSDKDIGLKGKKQMSLYANIKNPLRVNNREDLRYRLTRLSDTYSTLIAREASLDREYHQRYEDAQKAWREYVSEWSKKNPGAPRTAIYDDPKYQEIDDAEDAVLDEWEAASTELAAEIKDAITSALEDNGYDGIILREDKGSFGRSTDAYIALHPDQVKNVDNTNPTSNPDIRFSIRDSAEGLTKEEARAQAAAYTRLKAENAELRRRVEYWKGQTQRTKQATVRQTDVNRFARQLIKRYGSTADQTYIRQALQEMGDYLVQNNGEALDYNQLHQMAVTVAAELVSTAEATEESIYADDVADEILSTIRNTDIRLDRQYFNDLPEGFRRDFRGKLHIFSDKGRSVDSIYAELQQDYGYDLFPVIDNPADQLVMMGDIFDRLSAGPEVYNPFRGAENEATLSIANEIMDTMLGEDIRQSPPTMKDKADAKVAAVKAEGKQALDQLRSDKNARIQEIRRQESLRRQEIRAKEKAAKWDKVAAVKAYYQNMQKNAAEKRRENAASKKYRDRVFDKVSTLETWLRKNTDKEHIPEALKEPLIAFLSSIDLTSKQQLKGKGPTQRDIQYTDALQKIKDIVDNQAKYLNDPDNANGLDVYLDIPSGFDQSIKQHIESVNSILSGTDLDMSGPVVMMSSDQLKDLDFILTVLTNSIKKINQYITESHFASVMEGARDSNAYMKELGKSRDKTVIGDNAEKFTLWSNTLPYYAFKRFGAAGVERFQALMNGWGKMAMNVQTVMQFTDKTYSADEAKRWEENVRTIDLSDGSQVRMTDAQIMGLWCLARREQGLGHILVGGIRVGDIEPKGVNKKRIRQNDASHLTQDDLNSIFGMLSDRQIEVAKKLQEFLNTTCSEWGNEVSMARFGYRQFTEQFYYPINVDRNNLPMSDPQARETDIFRLLNMSATKALTPNANNSVVINSIFDVFAAHTADMAKYNGLALPILDLLKWYNYKDKSYRDVVDSLGNITTQMTAESVQSVMERTYGKMAQKYVMNFMKDLNGVREGGRNEELLKGMVGRYKAAAVGFNLRVVIQQPTSIARAAYVIDPRYLARGMAMKGGINEAMNHSGLAVWKSLGYFDTNIARNMRDQIKHTDTAFDKFTDKSMKLAELGDKVTWGAIWNAAKLEVKETRHLSGDALMKATQERFDEIILSTQVMDSTISRSDMMRNQSLAVSEVTSFRSEPTVTYNMLLDSYMDFNMELRKTKSASTAFRRTGMKMVRAATVYAVTTALTAAAAAIVDAFRDDDDYQTAVEKWIEHFWDNVKEIKEPWRLLPIVDQLYDIFLNNETPDSMLWQSFVQLKKSGASAIELAKMIFGDNPEATSRYTAWGKAYTVLQGLSSISGLPVSAAYRDLKAIWNASGALLWPDKKIKFYDSGVKNQVKYGIQDGYLTEEEAISILVESGEVSDPDDAYWITQEWLHADDSEWTRYNDLYAAILAGDKDAFLEAQEELGDHGIAAASVRTEAKNEIGRLYRGDDGTGRKLNEKQAVSYLMEFAGLGELEAKHLKDEWDLQRLYGLKVSEIGDAYVSGQITREEANDYYIRFGHDYPQDVKKKLLELDFEKETRIPFSRMSDAYIHEEITEQQAQAYLVKYGGLTQAEAESKTLQWDLARDYGIQYGSEDEGIKKALIEDFIDQDTAITIMEVYGGKTYEEAVDYSYQYLFTKETGYSFSEIQQALEDGVINEEQMADWYRLGSIYTHGSETVANEYVEVAKWRIEVPGAEKFNRTALKKWNDYGDNMTKAGMTKEDFADAWDLYQSVSSQYDSEGNKVKEKAEVFFDALYELYKEGVYSFREIEAISKTLYSKTYIKKYRNW